MDPNAVRAQMMDLARDMLFGPHRSTDERLERAEELANLLVNLDEWIRKEGGYLPRLWGKGRTRGKWTNIRSESGRGPVIGTIHRSAPGTYWAYPIGNSTPKRCFKRKWEAASWIHAADETMHEEKCHERS